MKMNMKVTLAVLLSGTFIFGAKSQTLLYSNDFEEGVNDAVIIGNGAIEDSGNAAFGKVFHNAAGGQAVRTNYLQLPGTIFSDLQESGANALTISFWVNRGTAVDYFYTPLFSAYGAPPTDGGNTWPMMILQSRGLVQVNNAGWCDFTNAQNVAGINTESTVWLDDDNWHFYTAIFTPTNVKTYIDGTVMNEWILSNEGDGNVTSGLFTAGSALTYICLGGNQAWNWNDPDAAYLFDKVKIHAEALTQSQIDELIAANNTNGIEPIALESIRIAYDVQANTIAITGLEGNEKVELCNVMGQKMNVTHPALISTKNLNKGVYLLNIRKGNDSKIQKLLIR
jgi:hypothetical protein